MSEIDREAVRAVLQRFQNGYIQRDPAALAEFRQLFAADDELEVIGTGGIEPGDDEWCLGLEAAMALVKSDWEGWGDLRIDVAGARIYCLGNAAWLATAGTVQMKLDPGETYQNYLDGLSGILADPALPSPRSRLLEVIRGAANTVFEVEQGEDYIWPIRFTAVLVRQDGVWRFAQMQFSYATTRFPDERRI